ncbi:MAG TPA: hypothetical protein VD973_11795 [Symbiobacteriaceae bacterium]|nr:hypothetical protein [Symbiobacteriaceae bacterium]
MTTTRDIRDLIAEEAASSADRRALEAVADRLGDVLSQDVPSRPAFKAELRRKLMAQARRQAPPAWYRRPAVWGSASAMAAAVGILAVGLTLWNKPPAPQGDQPQVINPATPGPVSTTQNPHAVSTLPELPRVALADEKVEPGQARAESLAGVNPAAGLTVYKLGGKPTAEQFGRMAAGLKFTVQTTTLSDGGWTVTQGSRSLRLTADGRVVYLDSAPAPAEGTPADADGAVLAARQFLLDASLPLEGEPRVLERPEGKRTFQVTYTRRFEGRPVVNIPTVVTVSDRGAVVAADAYVNFAEASRVTGEVITPEEARQKAQERGGTFGEVDLVYVRTKSSAGDWYMQPYWRAFGTDLVRYVAALK